MTARTLADPMFASIFNNAVVEPYDADAIKQALINHGEKIMNAESNEITCETGEERPTTPPTSIISSLGQAVPIQGVSGATYAPMDTSPQTGLDPIAILDDMMARFQISMRLMLRHYNKPIPKHSLS